MKKRVYRSFTLILLFMILGAPTMNFNVMVPASVSFPPHIKSVAMVDRTIPEDGTRSAIEGALTGEIAGEDKLSTQIMMDGIHSVMSNSVTLDFIRTPEVLSGASSVTAVFPEAIEWDIIRKLCSKYKVDAVMAIEIFDSDLIVIPGVSQSATLKVGIRMYDPAEQNILDQYVFSHQLGVEGNVSTIEGAIGTILNKGEAIRQVSYDAGVIYGKRITPSWYRVSRKYYRRSKGDDNLAEGARMMEVNDWEAARTALLYAAENGRKRKTRGRAAHNLAVVYEIEGDLAESKSWAQAAWGKYKNKDSREYLYDINQRINESQILDQQLNQ
jgi:hypothetical protein